MPPLTTPELSASHGAPRSRRAERAQFFRSYAPAAPAAAATAAAALVALGLSVMLSGCVAGVSGPQSSTPLPGLPEGVTVAVTQQRSDVADRQAEVQIRNGTGAAIRIGDVRLDDPRFSAPATRVIDRTSTLAPGATANVRVQLPAVACAGDAEAATSTVTIAYEVDGRAGTGTAPAAELFPFLAALHQRECVAQAVTDVADVRFGAFTPSTAGSPAALDLEIVPRAGVAGDLVLTGIRETNLLSFAGRDDGSFPLAVTTTGADRRAQTVALPLVPARCDPHAVQEDKRGTVFTLDVVVGGDAGQFTLAADADLKAQLLAWVTRWCGYG